MRSILPLLLLTLFAAPTLAQDEAAELREREQQAKVLEYVREIDVILESIRDHIRPTDNLQKLLNEPGTGFLARRALKAAELLSKTLRTSPTWMRGTKGLKVARRAAAAADLPLRLVRAILRAKTSSGSEKLEDLAQLIKDTRILVGSVVSVNPIVDTYVGLSEKAITNIAASAKVIEAATKKTNWAIQEAKNTIGRTDLKPTSHPLDAPIDRVHARIRALERKLNEKAYAEVEAAETHCAEHLKTTRAVVSDRRRRLARVRASLAELRAASAGLGVARSILRYQIAQYEKELPPLRAAAKGGTKAALEAQSKLRRKEGRLKILRGELANHDAAAPKLDATLRRRLGKYRKLEGLLRRFLRRYAHCVARRLKTAKHATRDYLLGSFPHYAVRPPPKPKAGAPEHVCKFGPATIVSRFNGSTDGWTTEGDAKDFKVNGNYLSAKDRGKGIAWRFKAPAKFLGDRSRSYGHALVFEVNQLEKGSKSFHGALVVIDDGTTLLYYDPSKDPPARGWVRITACLHESHRWFVHKPRRRATAEDFKRVLKNVKRLLIQTEHSTDRDVGGLREVILYGDSATPKPGD